MRNGRPIAEVAKFYDTHRSTVHRWVVRYKKHGGLKGLARRPVSGRPRKLQELNRRQLRRIVLSAASKYGYETDFWTATRLRQVIKSELGVSVCRQTIWRRLRDSGLTYQKPQRRYFQASEKLRKEWQETELPKIRAAVAEYRAILYFEDEAHISLTPILAKTWAPKGQTPVQNATGKRGGIAAMSAISSRGRLVFRLLEKRINSDDIISFLSQILKHHKRRHVVIVMDKASCHVSKKTKAFIESQRRLHVFYLPSYSPDWNPDEQVWNHLKNQEMKGHQGKVKAEVKRVALNKLTSMQRRPKMLRGIFFRCCVAELL